MTDEYDVAPYEPRYRDELLDLQTHLWGANREANAAYLDWKYFQNPYATRPHIYLARHEGKVIGMRGMYGSAWEIDGSQPLPTVMCAGDLVFTPEHRGRGLFTRIMARAEQDLAREGIAWLFNFSASVPTKLGSLAMGWRSVGPIATMRRESVRPGRMTRALRRIGLAKSASNAGVFRHLDRGPRRQGSRFDGVEVADTARPGAMAELVRRVNRAGAARIHHVRDERYFTWRFRNPRSAYRFLFLGREPLQGYLALQVRRYSEHVSPARIVDCEGVSPEARATLFAAAAEGVEGAALEVWTGTRGVEDRAALEGMGFAEKPVQSAAKPFSTILVRQLTPGPWTLGSRDLLRLSNWDVRMLDSDAS